MLAALPAKQYQRMAKDLERIDLEFGRVLYERDAALDQNARRIPADRELIRYSRGNIKLLTPEALRAAACECYGMIRDLEKGSR